MCSNDAMLSPVANRDAVQTTLSGSSKHIFRISSQMLSLQKVVVKMGYRYVAVGFKTLEIFWECKKLAESTIGHISEHRTIA